MALLAPRPVIHLGWLNERAGAPRRLQPAALSSVRRSRSHAPIPDAAMGAADSAALAQAHVSVPRVRPSIVARTVAGAASACRMSAYFVLRRCRVCEGGSIRGRPPPSGGTCSGELYDSSTSWYIPFEDAYGIASTDPAYRVPPITSPIESPHCCGIQNSRKRNAVTLRTSYRATIPALMSATLQREHWNGQPTHLGDLFRVSKMRDEKTLVAVCKLWSAQSRLGGASGNQRRPAAVGGVPLAG